jgi:transglutaminase-like putative cysteine protease
MRPRSLLAAACVIAVAGLALAETPPTRPVLHQNLPAPDHPTSTIGDKGNGATPAAFTAGDKILPKPALDASVKDRGAGSTEPVLGKGGFAADRQTDMRPDENTGTDSTLKYESVFNPDVLPFKRMSTFDQVGEDYALHVARTVLTEIPVGGATDHKTRDRFWGDMLIALKPGVDVPLPSVAPDMRILSYETKPRISLKFSKDGADNFYVRSDESSATGTYRLVFFADADAGYFSPALPPHRYTPREVMLKAPAELRPLVPEHVRAAARKTYERLNIDPDTDLNVAFNALVGNFRAFTAKTIPNQSGDIYRDLCDNKAGVCRHRSFAFMVTANALGIPTRYVENEAHAFVEVWFPERGWQRIDLGGAALRMDVSGANNKTLHRPRADDPFTKPPEYKQSYTQLEGEIHGLTDQQKADKRKALADAPPSGAIGNGPGSGGGSGTGSGGGATTPDRITPDQSLPAAGRDPKKGSPKLEVTRADAQAYRGDVIRVEGLARVDGKGIPDHPITIYLAPAGQSGRNWTEVGRAMTGPDGTFRVDLAVPAKLDLSSYEIYLSSEEDAYYNPALSD